MSDVPQPENKTVLDRKAEVVCAYVEAAGNIVETISSLSLKGIKIGRKRIETIIRTEPSAVEWTKKAFDKTFNETCGNRLEAVSAIAIQKGNENKFELVDKIFILWYATIRKIQDPLLRIAAYEKFVKAADTSAIKQNLIYSRFRDGLHQKQGALVDQSTHKTDVVNIPKGGLPVGGYDVLRAHVDRLKKVNGAPAIAVNGQGDNGATP